MGMGYWDKSISNHVQCRALPQIHYAQHGLFHVITNASGGMPWYAWDGVPEIVIDNIVMTRNLQDARLYAFCIMPDHVHLLLSPEEEGLSKFMQSFKQQSSRDVRIYLNTTTQNAAGTRESRLRESGNRTRATVCENTSRSRGSITPATHDQPFTGWQNGFYDEHIMDNRQRGNAVRYIHGNPVKEGLVKNIIDWPWSSLHFEDRLDPMELWPD